MAIKTVEEKKKQQKLLIIAGVMFLAAFLIIYFGVLKKSNTIDLTVSQTETTASQSASILLEQKLKRIDLNFDFLSNTILPFLKIHGILPVEKGTTGRTNPFINLSQ